MTNMKKRSDFPFIKVNGDMIQDDSFIEDIADDGSTTTWTFQRSESVTLSQLEIGLRKALRERTAQEDCIVAVEVHAGDEIKEKITLDLSNNFRCSWPRLEDSPITIEGFSVTLTKQGNPGIDARADETNGSPPYSSNHDRTISDLICAESLVHDLAKENSEATHDAAHSGLGKRKQTDSAPNSKGADEFNDHAASNSGSAVSLFSKRKAGATPEPGPLTVPDPTLPAAHATVAAPAAAGGRRDAGGGTPAMGSPGRPGHPSQAQSSGGFSVPQSPLGQRGTVWKLASHTVKLNRHQGTVDTFEVWRMGPLGANGRAGSSDHPDHPALGAYSAPHTPRSLLPETPSGSVAGWASPRWAPDDAWCERVASSPSPTAPHASDAHDAPDSDRHHAAPGHDRAAGRGSPGPAGRAPWVTGGARGEAAAYDVNSAPNQLLEALRFFEMPVADKSKQPFSWGSQPAGQMEMLARYIEGVAKEVRRLCLMEPRCIHVRAPCYILGDLHGNFQDLVAFEKALWRIGPSLSPANFVFLGDYVDRGQHSVEVMTYLLAQKLVCPHKFILLRGNHETRTQNSFPDYRPSFHCSCRSLFGEVTGDQVWEAVNSVFDVLPLAAIIDHSIFCVHGGIPSPAFISRPGPDAPSPRHSGGGGPGQAQLVAEINRIPRNLPQPDPSQGGNGLAWDLLWNDPAPTAPGAGVVGPDGFGDNTGRGTAHIFNADALNTFLRVHSLTHLVRAHEVRKSGFQVQQHAKMVTLFSSSGYCGATNEACCILACEGKIRFIRLDHSSTPTLGSLASRAAAASAVAAAIASGQGHTSVPAPNGGPAAPAAAAHGHVTIGGKKTVSGSSREALLLAAANRSASGGGEDWRRHGSGKGFLGSRPCRPAEARVRKAREGSDDSESRAAGSDSDEDGDDLAHPERGDVDKEEDGDGAVVEADEDDSEEDSDDDEGPEADGGGGGGAEGEGGEAGDGGDCDDDADADADAGADEADEAPDPET